MKVALWAAGLALLMLGCSDAKKAAPRPTSTRAEGVRAHKKTGAVNDTGGFCEKTFPSSGAGAVRFEWPALRPLPGQTEGTPPAAVARWRWVNLWATWCVPCMEEMGLLARWTAALKKERAGIALDLLSIDATADAEKLAARIKGGLPGAVHWLRGPEDFGALLDRLGVRRDTAIPIHALVDPKGQLRCVRVGAIGARDYAAVKSILAGG